MNKGIEDLKNNHRANILKDEGKIEVRGIGMLEASPAELSLSALEVIRSNSRGGFTIPARDVYPYQWLWDSCFAALGLARANWKRAGTEIETLLSGQWKNGMVSHIRFDSTQKSEFFPPGEWWESREHSGLGEDCSGITQVPIVAEMVWRIYELRPNDEAGIDLLKRVYPKLRKYHEWMKKDRDPKDTGLVFILHPDESGMDDLPVWDHMMEKMDSDIGQDARDMATKKMFTEPVDLRRYRPDHIFFSRIYHLNILLKKAGYESSNLEGDYPFKVLDPLFNSVWHASNKAMSKMAAVLSEHEDSDRFSGWAAKTRDAINENLWDEQRGKYMDVDARTAEMIPIESVSSYTPLFSHIPDQRRAKRLVTELFNKGLDFGSDLQIPSTPNTEADFDPLRYWRGPIWPFTNWLITNGLKECGYINESCWCRDITLSLAGRQGFREYYHPRSGEGMGAHGFTPMAAVVIDLSTSED